MKKSVQIIYFLTFFAFSQSQNATTKRPILQVVPIFDKFEVIRSNLRNSAGYCSTLNLNPKFVSLWPFLLHSATANFQEFFTNRKIVSPTGVVYNGGCYKVPTALMSSCTEPPYQYAVPLNSKYINFNKHLVIFCKETGKWTWSQVFELEQ